MIKRAKNIYNLKVSKLQIQHRILIRFDNIRIDIKPYVDNVRIIWFYINI